LFPRKGSMVKCLQCYIYLLHKKSVRRTENRKRSKQTEKWKPNKSKGNAKAGGLSEQKKNLWKTKIGAEKET